MKTPVGMYRIIFLFSLILFQSGAVFDAQALEKNILIVGWVEYATILPENLKIKAKLDTGARNSSLNAVNIVEFKRAGEAFARFDLTNWKGRTETIEAQVIRITKIKQHNSEPERRPVIRVTICLGPVCKEVEVNLVNRSNFNYQMLIGRSFLKGEFAVDPSRTFTIKTENGGSRKALHNE